MDTICDNKESLVGYLYDELDAAGRAAFEAHLAACADCRDEVKGLRATRTQLTSWAPPEPDFGFRIVREPASSPSRRAFWRSPLWGLAAAAVLILAVAAAIAQVEVRYDKDGFAVRTGWGRATVSEVARASVVPAVGVETVDWKAQATALERRLAALEREAAEPAAVIQPASTGLSDAQLVRRMKEMIDESEIRQQSSVAARMTAFSRAVDRQFGQIRVDLADTSGRSARTTAEMMNILRVGLATQQSGK